MLTVAATPAAASLPLMSPLPYFHARQMDLWKAVTWIIPPLSLSLSRGNSPTVTAGKTRLIVLEEHAAQKVSFKILPRENHNIIYYGSLSKSTDSGLFLLFHGTNHSESISIDCRQPGISCSIFIQFYLFSLSIAQHVLRCCVVNVQQKKNKWHQKSAHSLTLNHNLLL